VAGTEVAGTEVAGTGVIVRSEQPTTKAMVASAASDRDRGIKDT